MALDTKETELSPEFNWVVERFMDCGFSAREALKLALGGVDYHEAEKLLKSGCSPELALEILL